VAIRAFDFPLRSFPTSFADQPTYKLAKLEYTDVEALPNIGVGALYQREFRANDLYDPDFAVGGHQPYGFDQLMAQYYHFTVLYSKCTIEITDNNDCRNSKYHIWVCGAPGQLAATYAASGVAGLLEQRPHTPPITVSGNGSSLRDASTSITLDIGRQFRKTHANLVGDSRFQGDISTSPTEDVFFAIGGYHPAGTATTYTDAQIRFTITYWAVFTEPKHMATS